MSFLAVAGRLPKGEIDAADVNDAVEMGVMTGRVPQFSKWKQDPNESGQDMAEIEAAEAAFEASI